MTGSRGGRVERALASHQCGSGSIPHTGVICGLSLLLVFSFLQQVFLRVLWFSTPVFYSGFLLSSKTNTAKFQFDPDCTDTCLTSSRAWAGTRVVFWAGSCSFRERAQEKVRIKRNYIDEQRKKSKHENEQAE